MSVDHGHRKSDLVNKNVVRQIRMGAVTVAKTAHSVQNDAFYGPERKKNSHAVAFLTNFRRHSLASENQAKIVKEIRISTTCRGVYSMQFTPEEDKFLVAYGNGSIQLWSLRKEEEVVEIRPAPNHGFPIMSVRFLPESNTNFFAAGACGTIFLCDITPDTFMEFAKEDTNEINAIDVSVSAETLATGGRDAAIRLYDIETGKLKHTYNRPERSTSQVNMNAFHQMRVFAARFHPEDADILLTGGWDDFVTVWDIRCENGCVRQIRGPHICGNAIDIKDNTVLTGSWTVENSLQRWDLSSCKLIDTIVPVNRPSTIDGEYLYSAQYFKGDPTGNTVITGGSGVGAVEIIDIESKKVTSSFIVHKSVQAIDSTQKYVIFGGMETLFKICLMKNKVLP